MRVTAILFFVGQQKCSKISYGESCTILSKVKNHWVVHFKCLMCMLNINKTISDKKWDPNKMNKKVHSEWLRLGVCEFH